MLRYGVCASSRRGTTAGMEYRRRTNPWAHVMDIRTARLDLEHSVDAPRHARRFVSAALRDWDVPSASAERAQLLVSELVSNAVLHATGPIRLAVREIDGGRAFRVEVSNVGSGEPRLRRAAPEDLSGRGLQLVAELARGWGSSNADGETNVWFEVPTDVVV